MNRSSREKVRLKHEIARMRAAVDGLEIAARFQGPIGESAVMQTALNLASTIARHDAFIQVETESPGAYCERPKCPCECHSPKSPAP